MEIQHALDIINGDPVSGVGPRIVYKPDYVFHAQAYDYRIKGAILLTVSMPAPSTDRDDARQGYRKMLEPLHTTFPIIVDECDSETDFLYKIMEAIIELETHEAREFLRIAGTFEAPFHPHRIEGMHAYAERSGRHWKDDLNYGSYAPIPKSRRQDEQAAHAVQCPNGECEEKK